VGDRGEWVGRPLQQDACRVVMAGCSIKIVPSACNPCVQHAKYAPSRICQDTIKCIQSSSLAHKCKTCVVAQDRKHVMVQDRAQMYSCCHATHHDARRWTNQPHVGNVSQPYSDHICTEVLSCASPADSLLLLIKLAAPALMLVCQHHAAELIIVNAAVNKHSSSSKTAAATAAAAHQHKPTKSCRHISASRCLARVDANPRSHAYAADAPHCVLQSNRTSLTHSMLVVLPAPPEIRGCERPATTISPTSSCCCHPAALSTTVVLSLCMAASVTAGQVVPTCHCPCRSHQEWTGWHLLSLPRPSTPGATQPHSTRHGRHQ
jgi:hypothetical protein